MKPLWTCVFWFLWLFPFEEILPGKWGREICPLFGHMSPQPPLFLKCACLFVSLFSVARLPLGLSLFLIFALFSSRLSALSPSLSSVVPDSGLRALYYMLTVSLRLALAIIAPQPRALLTDIGVSPRNGKGRAIREAGRKEGECPLLAPCGPGQYLQLILGRSNISFKQWELTKCQESTVQRRECWNSLNSRWTQR